MPRSGLSEERIIGIFARARSGSSNTGLVPASWDLGGELRQVEVGIR